MENDQKNLGGRPTKFTPDLVLLAESYINDWKATEKKLVPTIEGLAMALGVAKKTLFRWEAEPLEDHEDPELYKRYCHCLDNVRHLQADLLIHGSLDGKMNSTISKLLLSNLGYREKSDVTSDDKPLPSTPIPIIMDEKVKRAIGAFEEELRPKRK